MRGFSIAGLLWLVGFVAIGFAALRSGDDFWVGLRFLVTLGFLCGSILGSVLERSRGGVWWLGFALFGWVYLVAGLTPGLVIQANLPSRHLSHEIYKISNRPMPQVHNVRAISILGAPMNNPDLIRRLDNVQTIGHWLFVLIFARAGATVSCLFTKGLPYRKRAELGVHSATVSQIP